MLSDASVSGIRAASLSLAVSSNNIANINTDGFRASRAVMWEQPVGHGVTVHVEKTDRGADLAEEMVNQLLSLRYGQANGKAFRIESETLGGLLDMWA